MNIRDYLKNHTLLLDGAMGTYFEAKKGDLPYGCEMANLKNPGLILEIHREYIQAGAGAILTNTFCVSESSLGGDRALQEEIVARGIEIAQEAAGEKVFVFGDMGPLEGQSEEKAVEEYIRIGEIFLKKGCENLLFETMSSASAIIQAGAVLKSRYPRAFLTASFGVMPDGYSREGNFYKTMVEDIIQSGHFEAVGLNCVLGPGHILPLLRELKGRGLYLLAMPNAGYPAVRNNRTFYDGGAWYFARQMEEALSMGISMIGGCCGTTPEHIKLLSQGLSQPGILSSGTAGKERKTQDTKRGENRLWEKLNQGKKVIAVELDSPKDAEHEKFMESAARIQAKGADILTIADCPIARARMDSCLLACRVKRDLDFDVMPHMTCRDRNINASKALLLGIYAEGIRNVLVITGDPIPNGARDEVRSVFQFNSRKFAHFISSLNQEVFAHPMGIAGALNINARNFQIELQRALDKCEKGVSLFLTQPVLSQRGVENIRLAKETLPAKILGGIIPVISERNARFMQNEVNGIHISHELVERYIGKNREEGEDLALEISKEMAERIAPYVDGFYLITVLNRIGLMERMIDAVQSLS